MKETQGQSWVIAVARARKSRPRSRFASVQYAYISTARRLSILIVLTIAIYRVCYRLAVSDRNRVFLQGGFLLRQSHVNDWDD